MKYYLAIDLGASSGRHIIGYQESGETKLEEIYRFSNGVTEENGHLVWDTERLFTEIKTGIKLALKKYSKIESLAIDTWGVDYVLMNGDKAITPCYAYRDGRTVAPIEKVHKIIPFKELFSKTGIEFQTFNTIYQLYADKESGRLTNATDFLMIPEYFTYMLTGVKKKEYTNATTTGMLNVKTHSFDEEIINKLGLKKEIFKAVEQPGYTVGEFTKSVQDEVGGNITVKFCASHDTASAVSAIEMDENSPYISSGTWSLLGVKLPYAITDKGENISNEGGINFTFRYQKNIMGMWIINELKKCLDSEMSFNEMVENAEKSEYKATFDVNDKSFFAPKNMKTAILDYLKNKGEAPPKTDGDIINSAYRSLAQSYKETFNLIERNTNAKYNKLYIVGGGAKNKYLNNLTEEFLGKKVIALPIEATALGNIKVQIMERTYEQI